MADQIDTRISPALHSANIANLDGYTDETAPLVASATEALDAAYGYLSGIHDLRAAAFADPTLTPEAALLKTDDHARAKLAGVTSKIDSAVAQFEKTIGSYERDLAAPVKQKAGEVISTEVRAHLKASPNRIDLVRKAIADGDDEVAASALGAPPMLSGLTPEIHRVLLVEYHTARQPVIAQRLRALRSAKTYLENHGGKVLAEAVKAVGGLPVTDARTGHVIRTDGPEAIRAKRDKSAAVYAKHA
ncbi:hypothetical protein [Frigidibacter sp. SD6-1]|uniref:hypothetical protein n=1 Tax=Frigidibacter sp. SD6-1 TaxID=3032581 RepID=UPI0024DF6FD7|nr:hypothetical protein [Frigidibacter sp. SD6-1]